MTSSLALAAGSYLAFYLWARNAESQFTVRRVALAWALGWMLVLAVSHVPAGAAGALRGAFLLGGPALLGVHLGGRAVRR